MKILQKFKGEATDESGGYNIFKILIFSDFPIFF